MKTPFLFVFAFACFSGFQFSACTGNAKADNPLNSAASLPTSFKFGEKGLQVLTSSFNRKSGQVSMLFGNAKAKALATGAAADSSSAEWDLVTWEKLADRHWFGAEIPGKLLSVETLTAVAVQNGHPVLTYTRYTGDSLTPDHSPADPTRIRLMLSMRPAIMP